MVRCDDHAHAKVMALCDLIDRTRARGMTEQADRLLLQAWNAYEEAALVSDPGESDVLAFPSGRTVLRVVSGATDASELGQPHAAAALG